MIRVRICFNPVQSFFFIRSRFNSYLTVDGLSQSLIWLRCDSNDLNLTITLILVRSKS
jgi:hypothetical protein